jgi:hypothetical protein
MLRSKRPLIITRPGERLAGDAKNSLEIGADGIWVDGHGRYGKTFAYRMLVQTEEWRPFPLHMREYTHSKPAKPGEGYFFASFLLQDGQTVPSSAMSNVLLMRVANMWRIDAAQVGADVVCVGVNEANRLTLDDFEHIVSIGNEMEKWGRVFFFFINQVDAVSTLPASELRFHLYWNAWRNAESTWMREAALLGQSDLRERTRTEPASIDVTRLELVSGGQTTDLLPAARFIAPDDGNEQDRTVLAVPLENAVAPGEALALDLAWTARVPRTFDRTGAIGNFFFVAQWFPKIGVLDDDGWKTHQFHPTTEFFADFGTYDVSLTVPAGWVVAATGQQASRVRHDDGTETHRYTASDVHDFAWSTSPDFVEVRRPFEGAQATVGIRLLLQPEHAPQADRHFAAVQAALARLERWFGAYPHPQLTIVDPVTIVDSSVQGGSVGGMEYPTLVTAGTNWYVPWGNTDPEDVLVHEIVHQYFQGIVATNEVEHAWLDEGLATYLTGRILEEAYPHRFVRVDRYLGGVLPWSYNDVVWSRIVDGDRVQQYRRLRSYDVPETPTWQHWPAASGSIAYARTSLWLHTLERLVGWDTVRRILAAYVQRGAWRHPTPDEFFAIASEVAGRDLRWFFDAVHRQAATFDYAVTHVSTEPQTGAAARHTVMVRRLGNGTFPVDVRVTFADGTAQTEHWDGVTAFRAFEFLRAATIRRVDVDPQRVLLLDVARTNNSWTSEPRGPQAATRWALHWMTWLQQQMLTYAFFI